MATYTEIQELILRTEGQPQLEQLRAKLQETAASMDALRARYEAGEVELQQYIAAGTALERSAGRTAAALKAKDDSLAGVAKGVGNYRQQMMALSFALNDFFSVSGNLQQRLNAIANNLPSLIGGTNLWGYALTGLLPAFALLVPQISAFFQQWAEGSDKAAGAIDRLKQELKALEEKPVKLAIDIERAEDVKGILAEIEAGLAAVRKLEKERTSVEQEAGKQVGKIVREDVGGKRAADALRSQFVAEGRALDPELKKLDEDERAAQAAGDEMRRMAEASKADPEAERGFRAAAEQADARLEDVRRRRAVRRQSVDRMHESRGGTLMERARGGDADAIDELGRRLMQAGEQAGDADLRNRGAEIRATTPEAVQRDRDEQAEMESMVDARAKANEAEKKRATIQARDMDEAFAGELAEADRWREANAPRERHAREAREARGKQVAANVRAWEGTGLDEQAAAAAALMRQQGGYVDQRTGRMQRLDETQQFATLAEDIQRRLLEQSPGMGREMSRDVAAQLSQRAFERADAQRSTGADGVQVTADAMERYIRESQQTIAAQAAQLERLGAMFTPAAAAAQQQRLWIEEQARRQQVQTFSALGGIY